SVFCCVGDPGAGSCGTPSARTGSSQLPGQAAYSAPRGHVSLAAPPRQSTESASLPGAPRKPTASYFATSPPALISVPEPRNALPLVGAPERASCTQTRSPRNPAGSTGIRPGSTQ